MPLNASMARVGRSLRRLVPVLSLALAGCAAAPPPAAPVYRDTNAPLSSQVDVTPARLGGDWIVRIGPVVGPVTAGQRLRLAGLEHVGPGRFRVAQGPMAGRVLWVLWLDADNRTAALATPEGDLGLILDRAAKGGADRIKAAREIMEWQGFDLRRMKEIRA